jgi:hypothetical protein
LNVKEGSKKDKSFDMEVAGLYLRRVDRMNRLKTDWKYCVKEHYCSFSLQP